VVDVTIGVMRPIIALILLFALSCHPTQNDPRYGTVTVAFGAPIDSAGPWRADQLTELRAQLTVLNALGPTFVEASEGTATLVVRPFDSGPRCERGAGRYTPGTTFVEVDPACTQGYTALRATMGHEIGHALGMSHVCARIGETSDCSIVGIGFAMMNPSLSYGDVFIMEGPHDIASDVPTSLDLAEWRRVHP
jgi:hypothetical protein